MKRDPIEERGNQHGKWTVLDRPPEKKGTKVNPVWHWHVKCECGTESTVPGTHLRSKATSQCRFCSAKANWKQGHYAQSRGMDVYFVRCGEYIKIGASNNVEKRLYGMSVNSPYDMTLEAIDEDEEFWHKVFEHRHHQGEWYHFPLTEE